MRTTTEAPLIELSGWMRTRLAERVNSMITRGYDPHTGPDVIVTPLGTSGEPGTRQDRECDRCARYVPNGEPFHLVSVQAAPMMLCVGGLCTRCRRLEDGGAR